LRSPSGIVRVLGLALLTSVAIGGGRARAEELSREDLDQVLQAGHRAVSAATGLGAAEAACGGAGGPSSIDASCPAYWYESLERSRGGRFWNSDIQSGCATERTRQTRFHSSAELSSFLSGLMGIAPPSGATTLLGADRCGDAERRRLRAGDLRRPVDADERDVLVADYYQEMAVLRQQSISALSTIASIDSLLNDGDQVLRGWTCGFGSPFPELQRQCQRIQANCHPQRPAGSGIDRMAQDTLASMDQLAAWKSRLRLLALGPRWIRDEPNGRLRKQTADERDADRERTKAAIARTELEYPWLAKGSPFWARRVGRDVGKIKAAIGDQLRVDRARALGDLGRYQRTSRCLAGVQGGDAETCSWSALRETLNEEARVKPVVRYAVPEGAAASPFRERIEDAREYMRRAACQRGTIEDQSERAKMLWTTGGTVALTAASGGLDVAVGLGYLGEASFGLKAAHAVVAAGWLAQSLPAAIGACASPSAPSGIVARLGGNLVLEDGSCPASGDYAGGVAEAMQQESCGMARLYAGIDALPLVPYFLKGVMVGGRWVRSGLGAGEITRLNIGRGARAAASAAEDAGAASARRAPAEARPARERAAARATDPQWAARVQANAQLSDADRVARARERLGRSVTDAQEQALLRAHAVGADETGANGGLAGAFDARTGTLNYTRAQLAEKERILREAGFTDEEIRRLMDEGIAGGMVAPADSRIPGPKPPRSYSGQRVSPSLPSDETLARLSSERRTRIQGNIDLSDRERFRAIAVFLRRPVPVDSDLGKAILQVQAMPAGGSAEKRAILRKAGLSDEEIRVLWSEGLVGRARGAELRQADQSLQLAREEEKAIAAASNLSESDIHTPAREVLHGPPPPKPEPLPYTGVRQAEERRGSGENLRNLVAQGKLKPGTYDYIVTDGEDVFSAERFPVGRRIGRRNRGTYNTHRSLLNQLRQTARGRMPRVIAAGEFRVVEVIDETGARKLAVQEVNNRSGSFRGGEDRLRYATRRMADLGLPMQDGTRLRAVGQRALENVHGSVRSLAGLHVRYAGRPEIAQIDDLRTQLARAYPDPSGMPGRFDADRILEMFVKRYIKVTLMDGLTPEDQHFIWIGDWVRNLNKEDPYWFLQYVERPDVGSIEEGRRWLQEALDASAGRPVTPWIPPALRPK
jgi:hypothetical protein